MMGGTVVPIVHNAGTRGDALFTCGIDGKLGRRHSHQYSVGLLRVRKNKPFSLRRELCDAKYLEYSANDTKPAGAILACDGAQFFEV